MAQLKPAVEGDALARAQSWAASAQKLGPPRTLWGDVWRRFRRHKLAVAGTLVFSLIVVATVVGPTIWRIDPDAMDVMASMTGSTAAHPMGTDDLGRDLLARVLLGGRISIAVGLVAMVIAMVVGTLVGSVAGYFGGNFDNLLMRLTDIFLALPQLPLLLLTIFLFRDTLRARFGLEAGVFILIVSIIGLLNWMPTARIVRAQFLSLKQKEFVEAANCLGVPRGSIMFRHILPNAMSPIIVSATLGVGAAIILESVLSFLGLGFPPDTPTWGRLLYDGQNFLEIAPHMVIWPGLMIFFTVLSINYMGDGLRDALDPRSRL